MKPVQFFSRTRVRGGFSLVEIMVVLVIIGLLASVVTLNVRGYLVNGKRNAAKVDVAKLSDAIETFYISHDRYPTNEEGIGVLTLPSDTMPEPLIDRVPQDPWGRPYQYNVPGREGPYELYSLGADGREGGDLNTAEADITNWNLANE